jgi:hypothetical protein
MAGIVHIPWYATVFRGDRLEAALQEIAPIALRYGATEYGVHRGRDDEYKFLQLAYFLEKSDFERYWYGDEFTAWRADCQGWYQVPVLYAWNDVVLAGHIGAEPVSTAHGAPTEGDTI